MTRSIPLLSSRRIGAQALLRLGAEAAGRAATFALLLWAARVLAPADFGRYNFALAWGFLLAQLADLGLQVLTAREIAGAGTNARAYVGSAFRLKLRLALVSGGLTSLVIFIWPADWSTGLRLNLLLVALVPLLHTFIEFAAYVFRGQQQVEREALLLGGLRLLAALLGALGLALAASIAGLALGQLAAALLLLAAALLALRRAGWLTGDRPAAAPELGGLLRGALPLGGAIFLSIAYTRLGVFLLQAWSGDTAVAQYSAAARLIEPLQIIPASLLAAVFPAYVRRRGGDPAGARRLGGASSGLLLLLALAAAAAAQLGGGWLIPRLYPDAAFAASVPVFRWLAWSLPPAFVNYSLTHYLIARGQQAAIAWFTGAMLLLHAALIRLLLPQWGVVAPALSTAAAELLLLAGCLLTLARPAPAGATA